MKSFLRLFIIYFLLLSSTIVSVHALIGFEDATQPEFITSARALGLGNSYIAKVDDSSSSFYNPAGLGTVRYAHFHLSNLQLEVNRGWLKAGTGGSLGDLIGNFSKAFKIDGMREILQKHRGRLSHSRFQFMPNFTARFISFGYLYSTQSRGTIGTQLTSLYEYADRTDHGPYGSLNISLYGGVFKFGITGIYLTRKEIFGESDPNTVIELEDSDYKKGSSFQLIGGAKMTLPTKALPTFALKINNLGSQPFSPRDGSAGAPTKVKPSLDVGFSLTPQIGKRTRIHLEANYKDLTNKYRVTSSRRFTLGAELDLSRIFFMRLGYGDGFGSGGFGIRTRKFEFDLTTYAIDSTSSEFRGKEDRRFALSLSSGL